MTDSARASADSLPDGPRYDVAHWSQWSPTAGNLERYCAANAAPYNATKTVLLDRLLTGDLTGRRLLDYGGGAGYYAVRCARRGAVVTLVDPEAPALALATLLARRDGVPENLTVLRGERPPPELAGSSFDDIVLKDVIEHCDDDVLLLRQLAACHRRGGRLLLSTQSRWSLNYLIEGTYRRWWCDEPSWCGWDPTHVRFYTPRSLARTLRAAGYEPRRWAGLYIVPYDLPSWITLLRKNVAWPALRWIDHWLGTVYPFSRCGWNVLVLAERVGG